MVEPDAARCSMYGIFTYMNGLNFTINLGKYSLHEAYGELDLASLLFARSCQLQPEHPMASRLDPDIGNKQPSGQKHFSITQTSTIMTSSCLHTHVA